MTCNESNNTKAAITGHIINTYRMYSHWQGGGNEYRYKKGIQYVFLHFRSDPLSKAKSKFIVLNLTDLPLVICGANSGGKGGVEPSRR